MNSKKLNYNKADFKIAFGISSQLPQSVEAEIAFCGRSNVGKSSCINKLFNRKSLARVSCVPGKTATINFYDVEGINFVDLPGYGYAKVSKSEKHRWSELIEGYFSQDRNIRLVISLVDMRHPPTELDIQMVEYLIERELPFIVVMTKSDKLNKSETARRLALIKEELPYEGLITLPFSGENGAGVEELREMIEHAIAQEQDLETNEDGE